MTNLYVPVGIPGSGKSTWGKVMFPRAEFVSSDQIRRELFGSLRAAHDVTPEEKRERNRQVWDIFYADIRRTLGWYDEDVYADGTNLRDYAREKLRQIALDTDSKMHVIIFSNTAEAYGRNVAREEDQVVPQGVMNDFLGQFNEAKLNIYAFESYDSVTEIAGLS